MEDVLLKKDQKVRLVLGKNPNKAEAVPEDRTATVIGKFGNGGGQGIVYKIQLDDTGEQKALKWYFANTIRESNNLRSYLEENVARGAPSPAYLWPEYLTEEINGIFGYVMPLIPKGYIEYSQYLLARASFRNYEAMVNAALNIVNAFKDLHDSGLSYQDFNDTNFCVRPEDGSLVIFDNDNVMGQGHYSGVVGKKRYMAPEVVRGEMMPDKYTDRYSMSLILFLILVGDHPLEGLKTNIPCLTSKYDRRFFGEQPLFIFDKESQDNAPVPGKHRNAIACWPYFPEYIQKAFQTSFSRESLMTLSGRRTERLEERKWMHLLMRLKCSIIQCPHCGETIFAGLGNTTVCAGCHKKIPMAGYLRFADRASTEIKVPIYDGVSLFEYHMDSSSVDFQTKTATIRVKPGKFGLENQSGREWTVETQSGSRTIAPGEIMVLVAGAKINFGAGTAEVVGF